MPKPPADTRRKVPDPETEPTITVTRAAAVLGVARSTMYFAVADGEIPSTKIRGKYLIPTARFLEKFHLTP